MNELCEYFDSIYKEIKTGWIQINDIESLVSKKERLKKKYGDNLVALGFERIIWERV